MNIICRFFLHLQKRLVLSVQKPSIPKGTRDFTPEEMVRRNFIFDVIREVFRLFGYQPIETPAMENLSTLLGKYGEEGDKLLFRILNSGNYLEGMLDAGCGMRDMGSNLQEFTRRIAEKGLRYDLTVPFARFVVQHRNDLIFPFKRFQIQPVWRADRPQKGRYREFFQCDVDVIGSNSLLNEVELVQIIDTVFQRLKLPVLIRLNNRKILAGIAEALGAPEKFSDITVAIDKLDKTGTEAVCNELALRGLAPDAIARLQPLLAAGNGVRPGIDAIAALLEASPTGCKGVEELQRLLSLLNGLTIVNPYEFDLTLARGLSYYTGTIIEVKAIGVPIGSLCGGGRYDDLTGIFGMQGVSGVGVSFGADRIYDVMLEGNLFPDTIRSSVKAMFVNFGGQEERHCLKLLSILRQAGITAEIYPDPDKIRKQMEYAHRRQIPCVLLAGKDEMETGTVAIKDMKTGVQTICPSGDLITMLAP